MMFASGSLFVNMVDNPSYFTVTTSTGNIIDGAELMTNFT
jgi:hypothetical protein